MFLLEPLLTPGTAQAWSVMEVTPFGMFAINISESGLRELAIAIIWVRA
jgi:hypothetical protein